MKAAHFCAAAVASLLPIAAFAQGTAPPEPAQPAQDSQQGATFESLDQNSDGRISKAEAAVNANVTEQFSKYDQNGNGFIEKDEVTSAITAPPADPAKQ